MVNCHGRKRGEGKIDSLSIDDKSCENTGPISAYELPTVAGTCVLGKKESCNLSQVPDGEEALNFILPSELTSVGHGEALNIGSKCIAFLELL